MAEGIGEVLHIIQCETGAHMMDGELHGASSAHVAVVALEVEGGSDGLVTMGDWSECLDNGSFGHISEGVGRAGVLVDEADVGALVEAEEGQPATTRNVRLHGVQL